MRPLVSGGSPRAVAALCFLSLAVAACSDSDGTGDGKGDIGVDLIEGGDADATDTAEAKTACEAEADCAGVFGELGPCELVVCASGFCKKDVAPNGAPCKDGFVCTGPDFCVHGQCGGGPLKCDDENPCTRDNCDGKVGCVHVPEVGAACDDGNPCTVDDLCGDDGSCEGGDPAEGCCLYDAECDDEDPCTDNECEANACAFPYNFAPCEDGDPCTLKDHCDGEGGCTGDPLLCDDGNPCTLDVCNPGNGVCETQAAADGTACEDGNPCTTTDSCEAGLCVGSGSICQCTSDVDCAGFEDGNLCNGTLKCLNFVCVVDPITVVGCNPTADTACLKSLCDPLTGQCVPTGLANGTECDDQNPCTGDDGCTGGLCFGTPVSCDDGNPCTFDACSPVSGCTHLPHTQPCNDGDACTQNDQCKSASCEGEAVLCDDFNPCTTDSCDPAAGCVHAPNSASCEDGNPCTVADVCGAGACVPGNNTCECQVDADCAGQEDANLCNGTLSCVAGKCQVDPATVVTCNTAGDTACSKTVCLPASGACTKQPTLDGTKCNDQNACTTGDACAAGLCVGAAAVCHDANPCTDDSCSAATGCVFEPNTSLCDDGNLCTGNDHCVAGACTGVAIACTDGNPCTVDSCDPAVGCVSNPAANGTVCSDGNVCTASDKCTAGVCAGTALTCNDSNPCTTDSCTNPGGCKNTVVVNGTPCDDGSVCSQGDQCVSGKCQGNPPSCDDGNPCTVDTCDVALGCVHTNAATGVGCTDGDPCTSGDFCDKGLCKGGGNVCECVTKADCAAKEDGNVCNGTLVCVANQCKVDPATVITCGVASDPCKVSTCNPATGACSTVVGNDGATCTDSNACTVNDTCQAGVCTGFPKACDDGNPCTIDACQNGACTASPGFDGNACADDGNSCTLDVCSKGVCSHPPVANGTACATDNNLCTDDVCTNGVCAHPPVGNTLPCADDGNKCTYDRCGSGVCQHISNDPAPVSKGECFPVTELKANTGKVTTAWTDCGVADQFCYSGSGSSCPKTGAIDSWACADPSFLYKGSSTGYEYSYVFVAPVTGTCTLVEYGEGVKVTGNELFGVIDWFILEGGGACNATKCLEYMWENKVGDPVCGGGAKSVCSYKQFAVEEGEVFYVIGDIYGGTAAQPISAYPPSWTLEMKCDANRQLLLNEDFTDAQCSGCTTKVTAGNTCQDFGWHEIGGFAGITTGYYVGQKSGNTLVGYDCGATTATVTFPTVTLPAGATSCKVTFDYYADLDPADANDCVNDVIKVQGKVGAAAATLLPGTACTANGTSANPIGYESLNVKAMSYDITAYKGSTFGLSLEWSADAAANAGVGVVIDNVKIFCDVP